MMSRLLVAIILIAVFFFPASPSFSETNETGGTNAAESLNFGVYAKDRKSF